MNRMTYQKITKAFETYCAEYFSLSASDMKASQSQFREQLKNFIEKAWDDGYNAGKRKVNV